MGGSLVPEETPGGGLTMVLRLPVSNPARNGPADAEETADAAALDRIDHWRHTPPTLNGTSR
jgi:two-component system sensor histidine kinase KdpD